MSKINPDESAFPIETIIGLNGEMIFGTNGLTKREYLAIRAPLKELLGMYEDRLCGTMEDCAKYSVQYADALIAELNKDKK